jgi:adenosylcobinamide-phosphate guanylyltransferase
MHAIIMAGGKGIRMRSGEKPMINVSGKPMVGHVLSALQDSNCFEKILAFVSGNTPKTAQFLASRGVEVGDTSGTDYVKDMNYVLNLMRPNKVFIISADLPLIDSSSIREIASAFGRCAKPCLAVVASKAFLDQLGIGADYCFEYDNNMVCNTGISVIDSSAIAGYESVEEEVLVMDRIQVALNVNTTKELELAERIMNAN